MDQIELHFTRGFDGETVVVSIDGREADRVEGVTTDMRTGAARRRSIQVAGGQHRLAIEVPALSARTETVVETAGLKFVTVKLSTGKLTIDPVTEEDYRREPRGYA